MIGFAAQAAKEPGRNVVLQWMYTNTSLAGVVGMSHERPTGEDQDWTLAVYAVCATYAVRGARLHRDQYTTDHVVSVSSGCGTDGLELTGGGFRYAGDAPAAGWLHTLRPAADLGSFSVHGRRDADSTADWWPELFPVCA